MFRTQSAVQSWIWQPEEVLCQPKLKCIDCLKEKTLLWNLFFPFLSERVSGQSQVESSRAGARRD